MTGIVNYPSCTQRLSSITAVARRGVPASREKNWNESTLGIRAWGTRRGGRERRRAVLHGHLSGIGRPVDWIVADLVRLIDGVLQEHWGVIQDEDKEVEPVSCLPMFGESFPFLEVVTIRGN